MIRFKKLGFTAFALSSAVALSACGDEEQVTQPVNNESAGETKTSPADASPGGGLDEDGIGGETYGFTELSIEVETPEDDDAIAISYEEDRDKVEAEYQNNAAGLDLTGDDAFNEMEQSLGQLDLSPDTADEEVISQIIEAFGIEDGFSKIQIEATYSDGTDKDYEQTNK